MFAPTVQEESDSEEEEEVRGRGLVAKEKEKAGEKKSKSGDKLKRVEVLNMKVRLGVSLQGCLIACCRDWFRE